VKSILAFILISACSLSGYAQKSLSLEGGIEEELNSVQGDAEVPPPEIVKESPKETVQSEEPQQVTKKKSTGQVEEELATQEKILKRKAQDATEISEDRNQDRYPTQRPVFKKPPGPVQGGSVRVEHPRAAQGLIRINKDGSYQYKTAMKEKSRSSSLKLGMMSPPQIESGNENINFKSMYGSNDVFALNFDYEWQPFRSFGSLGFRLGTGFSTATGDGFFKNQNRLDGRTRSTEKYTLFIVPASVFATYRFEFVRRQWVVPYITGGGTYYGLAEIRNDNKHPSLAAAPAAGGGGGLLLNISRLDSNSAFTLSQEYGIADMWLVVEALAMQGLSDDIDFTNQSISAGIQVDF
jgi:hypothetical protein